MKLKSKLVNFYKKTYKNHKLKNILCFCYLKVLQRNAEQTKIFTECRDKYKKIAEELQNLRKELKVNCMVPIGKKAFMKGQLVHTNEILALIGDGHFVKYSAEPAVGLCNRRIKCKNHTLIHFAIIYSILYIA